MAYIHPKTAEMLYLTADKAQIVAESDPLAAFVLVGPGGTLSDAEAARYGLGLAGESGLSERTKTEMAWTANRRLFWTADQRRVVEEGDPAAAMLFRANGQSISENEMQHYKIKREKAIRPGENKLGGPPAGNKVDHVSAEDADDLAASSGLGDDQRLLVLLAEQGITRKSQVAAMSDEELDALDGVGPATLRKLREAVG